MTGITSSYVVLHSVNCNYHIPDSIFLWVHFSERAREKVMREVKALAKLDHGGIVRYHQAWFENPPIGWQEDNDKAALDFSTTSPGFSVTEYTPTSYPQGKLNTASSKRLSGLGEGVDFNPLHPFDIIEESVGSGATERSHPDTESIKKTGSSVGFELLCDTSGTDLDEASDSYSFGVNSVENPQWCKDDSLDIVFENNDSCEELSNDKKQVPFTRYKEIKRLSKDHTNDSLDIVFEDSGCGEKSKSEENWDQGDGHYAIIDCSVSKSEATEACSAISSGSHTEAESTSNGKPRSGKSSHVYPAARPDSLLLQKKPVEGEEKTNSATQPKLYLYIQMQLCKRESLKEWLCNNAERDREALLDIFTQTVSAMVYVHDTGLMHRDLKVRVDYFCLCIQVIQIWY